MAVIRSRTRSPYPAREVNSHWPLGLLWDNLCGANDTGVGGKESVLGVSCTFGDPLSFRLDGVSFVEESLKLPVGEVAQLQNGQVVLGVHGEVSSIDDVPAVRDTFPERAEFFLVILSKSRARVSVMAGCGRTLLMWSFNFYFATIIDDGEIILVTTFEYLVFVHNLLIK